VACGSPVANRAGEHFCRRRRDAPTYSLTFETLLEGLDGFVTVTDAEIAETIRVILKLTHNLVERAGALGLAAAIKLRDELKGMRVGVIFSGGNLDTKVLERILSGAI
jgi:threonine dehydratase